MDLKEADLLGPLAPLQGIWEGTKGNDRAPSDDRGVETNLFRERWVCEPTGLVQNHEQYLHGLRYKTIAWRIGEENAFHETLGYWLWDAARSEVMRCFLVPRGVSVIAGGRVERSSTEFSLVADLGSPTYGVCSGPFLHDEFRTTRYSVKLNFEDKDTISYIEETRLLVKGAKDPFLHVDKNTLTRVFT
jgi:hypothetical protein